MDLSGGSLVVEYSEFCFHACLCSRDLRAIRYRGGCKRGQLGPRSNPCGGKRGGGGGVGRDPRAVWGGGGTPGARGGMGQYISSQNGGGGQHCLLKSCHH